MPHPKSKTFTEDDYYNLPEHVRAELIDGQFYNMSAPGRLHQKILSELHTMINNYIKSKDGSCEIYPAPFAVKLFDDRKTIVEPDLSVICDKTKLTDKGCSGAPDWIIEIVSPSTSSHDYVHKLNLYLDAGVREYWIVNPQLQTVDIYFFEENPFGIQHYTFRDTVKVNIYDDLYLDFSKLDL